MARYEHLLIYKKAMDLAVYTKNAVRGFSRYHKYSIGADIRNLSRRVVTLIIAANSRVDKLAALLTLRDTIEELKVVINICKEVKAFKSFTSFQKAAEAIVDIGRQSEGRIKAAQQRSRAEGCFAFVASYFLSFRGKSTFYLLITKFPGCFCCSK